MNSTKNDRLSEALDIGTNARRFLTRGACWMRRKTDFAQQP
jgi:hypothetical protein